MVKSGNNREEVNPHVLLIQSCKHSIITDKYAERYPYPPIGLHYLSGILKMNGYRVTIIDLYLEALSKEEFIFKIKSLPTPSLVGISSYTDSILDAYKVAAAVKSVYKEVPVIMGGPHVTFMYEEVLNECKEVDFVCRGEGEGLIIELLEHLRSGVPALKDIMGLAYRDENNKVIVNEKRGFVNNLDILPLPWFSKKMIEFMKEDGGLIFVSSRGCPGNCIFCASRALSGSRYRFHSAEWLISLIYFYFKMVNIKLFGPLDDTFTVNRSRLKRFVGYLKELGLNLPWSCKSRVDIIDEELVRVLKSARCLSVHIGIESGDDRVLKEINKGITLEQVFKALRILAAYGLRAECSFILGHPMDTLQSMERTLILATRLDTCGMALSVIGICTPFPGTTIYENREDYKIKLLNTNWRVYDLGTPIFETDNFSSNDLRRAFFYFNYQFKTGQQLPELTGTDHSDFIEQVEKLVTELSMLNMKEREGA